MIERFADLRLFALIVERGSLTAAAREVGLSPGAVSLRLSALDLGRNHIAPALDAFIGANPGLRVSLFLSDTLLDLNEAGVDLAVRYGRLPDSALQIRRLSTNRRLPVA